MWDDRDRDNGQGILINSGSGPSPSFSGAVGNTCVYDVMTDQVFPCSAGGDIPYCPPTQTYYWGWAGSKLFVLLASAPYYDAGLISDSVHCYVLDPTSDNPTGGWHDAPWIGISHGEMVRGGNWGGCHCYANSDEEWWLADGCGQFNVWEIVNDSSPDNDAWMNLELYSTNFFGYQGYIGYGPPNSRTQCRDEVQNLDPAVDLALRNDCSQEVSAGSTSNPDQGPDGAFVRPTRGYRFFVVLMDVDTRTVQLAIIHPDNIPPAIAPLLPGLPASVTRANVEDILALRLPR